MRLLIIFLCFITWNSDIKAQADTLKFRDLIFADYLSPNNDGKNDFFVIWNVENYPSNELRVFNRWGETVYNKKAYNNEFNGVGNVSGVYDGNELIEGVYFYEFKTGTTNIITGKFTLDR